MTRAIRWLRHLIDEPHDVSLETLHPWGTPTARPVRGPETRVAEAVAQGALALHPDRLAG